MSCLLPKQGLPARVAAICWRHDFWDRPTTSLFWICIDSKAHRGMDNNNNNTKQQQQNTWRETKTDEPKENSTGTLSSRWGRRGSGGEKHEESRPDSFWRSYNVGRDPWLAWWDDSSASCVLSHASLICVLILSGLTRLHWGFCFKFQVLLDNNSSWAIITRCYSHQ